ncbi:MAG: GH36-type glycosyl hydrolase domain-containing protein [Chthoniobacteraceae bacterium]
MQNPYGHFDDAQREYLITNPATPLPWINYLGCEEFFGIISNTAGGYCFDRDARLRRLTRYRYNNVPLDSNGRYLYIKDGDTVWNPGWKPTRTALDRYECRHGMGYSVITGEKNGLEVSVRYFIPVGEKAEVWDVRVRNLGAAEKSVSLWGFVEWCLWDAMDDQSNFQRNFSTGQVEVEANTVFHVTEYRERRDHFAYFSLFGAQASGFEVSRDRFVGVHEGLDAPRAVLAGKCSSEVTLGWAPVAAQQIDLTLAPGGEKRFHFLLGVAENPHAEKFSAPGVANKAPFRKVAERLGTSAAVDEAFAKLKAHWDRLLSIYHVEIDDPHVSRMVNIWNQYQCMTTLNLSRSASFYESGIGRGMGYRDSNQDLLGVVHIQPERARERLLDLAATQCADGSCYHQYQPLTKKGNTALGGGFNDDPLWLPLAVAAYLNETGDTAILSEKIGYADKDNQDGATLLDHLEVSIAYTLRERGPHGLPLIGHADWNDCLNLNCHSTTPGESFQLAGDVSGAAARVAESVMIAGLFCAATESMAGIYQQLGQADKAAESLARRAAMQEVIEAHGWDGKWFLRAYDAFGEAIGSAKNDEGQIFIESQGWGVLGGVGLENGHALAALDSVAERLATPNGIILQQPAYSTYQPRLGEITSYPPGYKENAGIFTHNNTWIQVAEALVGRGDKAFEYYMSVCPSGKEEQIDTFRCEPYVYNQMTAGRDALTPGEGKNSWLTGTAAWCFVAISQYILGVRPGAEGLVVDPCIPRAWKGYKVDRVFRGATYHIEIQNPGGASKGIKTLCVNGQAVSGNVIPIQPKGAVVNVVAVLG